MGYLDQRYQWSDRNAATTRGFVVGSLIKGTGDDDDGEVRLMIVKGDKQNNRDRRYGDVVVIISDRHDADAPHPNLGPGGGGGGGGGDMSVSAPPPSPSGDYDKKGLGQGWGPNDSPPRGYVRSRTMVIIQGGTI